MPQLIAKQGAHSRALSAQEKSALRLEEALLTSQQAGGVGGMTPLMNCPLQPTSRSPSLVKRTPVLYLRGSRRWGGAEISIKYAAFIGAGS